jgi:hypothetical protein
LVGWVVAHSWTRKLGGDAHEQALADGQATARAPLWKQKWGRIGTLSGAPRARARSGFWSPTWRGERHHVGRRAMTGRGAQLPAQQGGSKRSGGLLRHRCDGLRHQRVSQKDLVALEEEGDAGSRTRTARTHRRCNHRHHPRVLTADVTLHPSRTGRREAHGSQRSARGQGRWVDVVLMQLDLTACALGA